MHQHDERSIATALAIFASRQPNGDARKSFFPHIRRVYPVAFDPTRNCFADRHLKPSTSCPMLTFPLIHPVLLAANRPAR
jgi:hypothetical protein